MRAEQTSSTAPYLTSINILNGAVLDVELLNMCISLLPRGRVNQGEVLIHYAQYLVIVLLNHFSQYSRYSSQLAASAAGISELWIHDATKDGDTTEITRLLDSVTDVDINDAVSRCIATKRLLNVLVYVSGLCFNSLKKGSWP